MNVKYVNHFGESIDLCSDVLMLRDTDLLNYSWDYQTKNEFNPTVSIFYKSMVEKNIKISIIGKTKDEYNKLCNKLFEITEKDIIAAVTGFLIVNNEYRLPCYIFSKKISAWHPSANKIVNEYTILSEKGEWLKDVTRVFGVSSTEKQSSEGLDYSYDFPFDYSQSSANNLLKTDAFVPFDFTIIFSGPCTTPYVQIGDNIYRVYTTLLENEYLTIDSLNKKIYKTKNDGKRENEFNLRDRNNYIFEKIQPTDGLNYVDVPDGQITSITAHLERSEPKWT